MTNIHCGVLRFLDNYLFFVILALYTIAVSFKSLQDFNSNSFTKVLCELLNN